MAEEHEHVHEEGGRGVGSGMVIGVLLVILVVILFVLFGTGIFQGQNQNTTPNVEVPDQIDVNVQEGTGQ